MKNGNLTRSHIVGLVGLIVFALVFIFSCFYKSLFIGNILVGTFGYMVFPMSFVFMFLCLAKFLGFSYVRSSRATAFFVFAVIGVLLAIHSVSTFEALDIVVTWKTFSEYLALSYTNLNLIGSFGSIFCGAVSMLLGAMGTIFVFVIFATIFIGLFIDYQIYGKYEEPKVKKLKTRKMREKVQKSDDDLMASGEPKYSFAGDAQSEISVDANEYEESLGQSTNISNYTDDDVVGEISDGVFDEENSNVTSFESNSNYFGANGNESYEILGENQTQNQFSNDSFGEKDYPDIYNEDPNHHRREFMSATFGGSTFSTQSESNEKLNADFVGSSINNGYDLNSENEENIVSFPKTSSGDLWGFGENSSEETSQSEKDNFDLDNEISKLLQSSEDDENEVKKDVFGNENSSNQENETKNNFGNNNVSNAVDQEILNRNSGFDQSLKNPNLDNNSYKNISQNNYQINNRPSNPGQNFASQNNQNEFSNKNFENYQSRNNQELNQNQGGYFGQNNSFDEYGQRNNSPLNQNNEWRQNSNPMQGQNYNNSNFSNSNFAGNLNQNEQNKGFVVPPKEIKTPSMGVNLGMTGLRYNPPPLSLLKAPKADVGDYTEEQNRKTAKLENVLSAFNIPAKVINIVRGPKITRYELSLPLGVSVKKIPMFEDDIAAALAAKTIVIKAPIPGSPYVGIELENDTFTSVSERELLESDAFQNCKDPLPIAIGKDISGEIIVKSLAKMVHLLIAGSTGSGKSVFIHNIVLSLIYKSGPDDLRLIMIDPKKVEFNRYNGLPHLLTPEVVMGSEKAINALKWCVKEMDRRYDLMSKAGFNNIEPYNKSELVKAGQFERFPYIVIIVDELAEIMMVNKKEVEACIQRITQLARACGMHLILATQRPSVDIISGVIKNNVPSRIAFSLQSGIDSKTILNTVGAEKLLGQGDMIFAPTGTSSMPRLQAAYASDSEIQAVIDYDIKYNKANYDEEVVNIINKEASQDDSSSFSGGAGLPTRDTVDSYFKEAVRSVILNNAASTSALQRRLSIGYSRAAKIIDQMEARGYVSPASGSKSRKILITPEQFKEDFGEEVDGTKIS